MVSHMQYLQETHYLLVMLADPDLSSGNMTKEELASVMYDSLTE